MDLFDLYFTILKWGAIAAIVVALAVGAGAVLLIQWVMN